ncbi:MAG: hypothetical protein NVSMB25_03890 [Thermoleophilaceae bacterium]
MNGSSVDLPVPVLAELAERWRRAFIDATPQAFGACCAVAVRYEDPLAQEPIEGLDAVARHAERLRAALPDMRLEQVGAPVGEGGFGALPWRVLGTHKGEVGGVPASGRFLVLHGVHYVELRDGLIRRARGFFDLYEAAVQLGLLPTHGSLGESAILMLRGFGLRPRA